MNRPHIVFIMADDMGYGDLGCYGATKISTPHMDRVASEGIRFTDAHSASAVCTPSRYGVLTGRYCWRSAKKRWVNTGFSLPLVDPARLTVASLLQSQGYGTAAIGKWHVGLEWQAKEGQFVHTDVLEDQGNLDYTKPILSGPNDLGFDHFFGISASLDMPPYCFIENRHTVGLPTEEKSPYHAQQRKGTMTPGWKDEQVDVRFAEEAVQFIERHVKQRSKDPFFLYLTPSSPHRPCVPPAFLQGASQAGPRGDSVMVVDWVVGQILDALDRLHLAENTLIIVTSDNGARLADVDGETYGHKACGDWRGCKADIWDGGHREPFVCRWPGKIEPGTVSQATICLTDLISTCAAIVGETLPRHAAEDSCSLLSVLTGQRSGENLREALVHHSGEGLFAVRKDQWKLVFGLGSGGFTDPKSEDPAPGGPKGQLYDMEKDPQEGCNLWLERKDVVDELASVLERFRLQGRSVPFDTP